MIVVNCPSCRDDFRIPTMNVPADSSIKCPWCNEMFPIPSLEKQLPPVAELLDSNGDAIEWESYDIAGANPFADTASDSVDTTVASGSGDVEPGADENGTESILNDPANDETLIESYEPPGEDSAEDELSSASNGREGFFDQLGEAMDSGGDGSAAAESVVSVQKVPTLKAGETRPTFARPKRHKTSAFRTIVSVALGPILALPLAGGVLLALGKAPDLGFYPFDGTFNNQSENNRRSSSPVTLADSYREPVTRGRSLMGDKSPIGRKELDDAASQRNSTPTAEQAEDTENSSDDDSIVVPSLNGDPTSDPATLAKDENGATGADDSSDVGQDPTPTETVVRRPGITDLNTVPISIPEIVPPDSVARSNPPENDSTVIDPPSIAAEPKSSDIGEVSPQVVETPVGDSDVDDESVASDGGFPLPTNVGPDTDDTSDQETGPFQLPTELADASTAPDTAVVDPDSGPSVLPPLPLTNPEPAETIQPGMKLVDIEPLDDQTKPTVGDIAPDKELAQGTDVEPSGTPDLADPKMTDSPNSIVTDVVEPDAAVQIDPPSEPIQPDEPVEIVDTGDSAPKTDSSPEDDGFRVRNLDPEFAVEVELPADLAKPVDSQELTAAIKKGSVLLSALDDESNRTPKQVALAYREIATIATLVSDNDSPGIKTMLSDVAASAAMSDLAGMAPEWYAYPRRKHSGILVIGSFKDGVSQNLEFQNGQSIRAVLEPRRQPKGDGMIVALANIGDDGELSIAQWVAVPSSDN